MDQSEKETTESQFMRLAVEAQNRRAMSRLAVSRAMAASNVLPKQDTMPEDVLKAVESLPNTRLHVSEGGGLIVGEQNGQPMPLAKLVEQALLTNQSLADGRSTKHFESDPNTVQARTDLSMEQKVRFISQYGLSAWEALPATRRTEQVDYDPTRMTAKQYLSLTVREKVEYLKRPDVNEAVISAILLRK